MSTCYVPGAARGAAVTGKKASPCPPGAGHLGDANTPTEFCACGAAEKGLSHH